MNNDVLIISQERASNQSNIKTMVTFTLTPDNADELPRNAVHLIVAEGVTEIPEELCCRYGGGIDSLETVVFSKSVTVFGKEAFYRCPNLRSVVFPKDSQLRVIRRGGVPLKNVIHCEESPFQTTSLQLEIVLFINVPTLNQ